jgi:hypothetical protein
MVRYADDFVVLGRSARELRHAESEIAIMLKRRGLALNALKTRFVPPGEAFVFLGQTLCAPARGPDRG